MVEESMKFVPIMKTTDMARALKFYTGVLDFTIAPYDEELTCPVIDLLRDGAKLQISTIEGDGMFGTAVNVEVGSTDELDELFRKYETRGLDTHHPNSPVHCGPVDQSWGTREFYVTDPDRNTLRFRAFPE